MRIARFGALAFVVANAALAACSGQSRSSVPPPGQDYRQGGRLRITPQSVCHPGQINPCGDAGDCGIYWSTLFQTPFAFSGRETLGVGEEVNMTSDIGFVWTTFGGGSVNSRTGNGVVFKAGSRPGTETVTVSGILHTCIPSTAVFEVVAPTVALYNVPQGLHSKGYSDIGFYTNIYETPNYVNFYNTSVREDQAAYAASGIYACKNGILHEPGPVAAPAGTVVDGIGTMNQRLDKSYSGACDNVDQHGNGSMSATIVTEYQVNGDSAWYPVNSVTSVFTAAAPGNLTHSKDHASWNITVDNDTIGCPCQ